MTDTCIPIAFTIYPNPDEWDFRVAYVNVVDMTVHSNV
jgi:hypothetical protein